MSALRARLRPPRLCQAHHLRRVSCRICPATASQIPSHVRREQICALRAPTLFSVRMKSASAQKTAFRIKSRTASGCFYPRSPIAHGCAFHPCAIGDPRGRFLVRAGFAKTCALRAPTLFSVRMKSASAQKTGFWIKARAAWGCFCLTSLTKTNAAGLSATAACLQRDGRLAA